VVWVSDIKGKEHFIYMDGKAVYKLAVNYIIPTIQKALAKTGLTESDLDFFIPHQANMRILKAVAKQLQVPFEKVVINVERYGNMSSASTAVALHEAVESGRVKEGDNVTDWQRVKRGAKISGFYNPRILELQKQFAKQLLLHKNPYTKICRRTNRPSDTFTKSTPVM